MQRLVRSTTKSPGAKTGALTGGLLLLAALPAPAQPNEALQFFAEEAQIITASRNPVSRRDAPATVYVVTAEDIAASGARTVWDALRGVPGVHVLQTRAGHAEVSIRGRGNALQNRVLVLLDGKTALNAYFNNMLWDALPVTLDEIDRIEVVEGPASALYGANAIDGVINVITKTPEKLMGGLARFTEGNRNTRQGTALYGGVHDRLSYKVGLGWNTTNEFTDHKLRSSEVRKAHSRLDYRLADAGKLSLTGGYADEYTQFATSNEGVITSDGPEGFLRADLEYQRTSLRAFWNSGRNKGDNFLAFPSLRMDYDTTDVEAQQRFSLPGDQKLAAGGGYRRNTARSTVTGSVAEDLWSLFLEDEWRPSPEWIGTLSGRMDRHPRTGLLFSPRVSLAFLPDPRNTLRASAGTSFRNPTLIENYLAFNRTDPAGPPFTTVRTTTLGNPGLMAEKTEMAELAHDGRFGMLKTTEAVYRFRHSRVIAATNPAVVGQVPPTLEMQSSFTNLYAEKAWGGEVGAEAALDPRLSAFANYAFIAFDKADGFGGFFEAPEHKVNAGLRGRTAGLSYSLQGHWVSASTWPNAIGPSVRLPDYLTFDAGLGYAFRGRLKGLEVGVSAFNVLDRLHREGYLQVQGAPSQSAEEVIGSLWTGTLSYRF